LPDNKFSGIILHDSLQSVKSMDAFDESINVNVLLSVTDPSFKLSITVGEALWIIHIVSTIAFSSKFSNLFKDTTLNETAPMLLSTTLLIVDVLSNVML